MQKYSRQRHPAAPGQMWASGVEFAKEEKARVLREIEILSQLSHVRPFHTCATLKLTISSRILSISKRHFVPIICCRWALSDDGGD